MEDRGGDERRADLLMLAALAEASLRGLRTEDEDAAVRIAASLARWRTRRDMLAGSPWAEGVVEDAGS